MPMPNIKKIEVFDVSGAGDTVLAYLSSSISKGESLESSIKISNVAAGLAVAKFGTSVVSIDEIENTKQIKIVYLQVV